MVHNAAVTSRRGGATERDGCAWLGHWLAQTAATTWRGRRQAERPQFWLRADLLGSVTADHERCAWPSVTLWSTVFLARGLAGVGAFTGSAFTVGFFALAGRTQASALSDVLWPYAHAHLTPSFVPQNRGTVVRSPSLSVAYFRAAASVM